MTNIELERLKMYQDSFKHMMTFCSGAILLSAAVTGALFMDPKPYAGFILAISIVLFALGAAAAMFGLVWVSRDLDLAIIDESPDPRTIPIPALLWSSLVGAYFGLALFAYFAWVNLTT